MPIVTGVPTGPEIIRTEFERTYDPVRAAMNARLGNVMDVDLPSSMLTERYHYYLSAPVARRWDRNEGRTRGSFQGVQWNVVNKRWEVTVAYHEDDVEDDQSGGGLKRRAADGARSLAQIDERVFYQILTGGSDPDLLKVVPIAPDGAALFSATDGAGDDRFGVSGGNIITGSGVASEAAIRTDIYSTIVRAQQFQDSVGQPFYPDEPAKRLTVLYGIANHEVVIGAFAKQTVIESVSSTAGVGAAGVSNIILAGSLQIQLIGTARITDNDMFVFLDGAPVRPIFSQLRRGPRATIEDRTNSDRARDTGEEAMLWDMRKGYGVALPLGVIKINN